MNKNVVTETENVSAPQQKHGEIFFEGKHPVTLETNKKKKGFFKKLAGHYIFFALSVHNTISPFLEDVLCLHSQDAQSLPVGVWSAHDTMCPIICDIPHPGYIGHGSPNDGILRKCRNHFYVPILTYSSNCQAEFW